MRSNSLFFFKQKTAYEMRISDWSSDVCSSDLTRAARSSSPAISVSSSRSGIDCRPRSSTLVYSSTTCCSGSRYRRDGYEPVNPRQLETCTSSTKARNDRTRWYRSEEHTSELQSLMRISYAVFCLKKKNTESIHVSRLDTHTKHSQTITCNPSTTESK